MPVLGDVLSVFCFPPALLLVGTSLVFVTRAIHPLCWFRVFSFRVGSGRVGSGRVGSGWVVSFRFVSFRFVSVFFPIAHASFPSPRPPLNKKRHSTNHWNESDDARFKCFYVSSEGKGLNDP